MQFIVLSDVHGNLEALMSVIDEVKANYNGDILFLGDSAGYGPDPSECIRIIREVSKVILAGNHDWAATGRMDTTYFNPYARTAIEWTQEQLTEGDRAFLDTLPLIYRHEEIYLVHSTPKEPEQWHYLLTKWDAYINFHYFDERICFIGHSHQPVIIEMDPEGEIHISRDRVDLKEGCRYIVNAGSVGQPRDGNPDASYVVFDGHRIEIKRVPYDIVLTQEKMRRAGLPEYLIQRLAVGR
jgi:diadenosine tetraphosphatase ApaH/serine/threonine PP2A family protein phosphatase